MHTTITRKPLTIITLALITLMSLLAGGIAGHASAQSSPTETPDAVATAIAATVAALQPPTETPDIVATAIAGTVAALQPPAATPTPTGTPDVVASAVAATLAALGVPTGAPTPMPEKGTGQISSATVVELFRDSFDNNGSGWTMQEDDFASTQFINGRYAITVSPESNFVAVPLQGDGASAANLTQPYDVSVRFRMSENYNVLVGIGYNIAPDFSDGRWVGINAYEGGWRSGRLNFGSANVSRRGDRGLAIPEGETVTFRLIVNETWASLYLNDVLVATVPNDGITGTIGFVILTTNYSTTVELDELIIRTVNEATLPPTAGLIIDYTITDRAETVESLNLPLGSSVLIACTGNWTTYSYYAVWGTDTYTANSSICRAALHNNLPWYQPFLLTVLPGQDRYTNSTRNGVKTESFGSYPLSFSITPLE